MAVSHQWFIQWSEPSMLFTDITNKHNNINNWNQYDKTINESKVRIEHNYLTDDNIEKWPAELRLKDRKTAAGITLWLTMLGIVQPQSVPADTDTPPFNTLYKWKSIDFDFPSPRMRNFVINSGDYVPDNVLPLGVEVWGPRVWVTFPNWRGGVPVTLATVPRAGGLPSPPFKAYPDWTFHRAFRNNKENCSKMTSVFRVNIDPCGKLWVLDSGQIDLQDNPKQVCPPSIFVFDLHTDTLVARYIIPQKYVLQDSLYANIVVDTVAKDCSDLHAYISDTWRFGLLVFRQSDESFWRFSSPLFYPDPLAANLTLHGLNFQWPDGIFGLSLSPVRKFEERILFFRSLAGYREFYVSTFILKDETNVNRSASAFHVLGESRGYNGQASASAMDRRGVLFYGLVIRDSIGCWDYKKVYRRMTQGVVAYNKETLIFPNDIRVDQEPQQSVWLISNRLPMFQAGSLDPDDYNYRLLYADTEEAVRGTVCDPDIKQVPRSTMIHKK